MSSISGKKNREIKFRMWDSRNNTLKSQKECLEFGYYPTEILSIGGKEVIWMQFTGLKDRNGKEIYEGDIVEFDTTQGRRRSEVTFDRGSFSIWISDGNAFPLWNITGLEHIGNIYENPDLLTPPQ